MNQVNQLSEQHILESESHLRHIDELMAQAHEARAKNLVQPEHEPRLNRFAQDRDRLAQELHSLRDQARTPGADIAERGKGLAGVLKTVGLELEKALGAIFNRNQG